MAAVENPAFITLPSPQLLALPILSSLLCLEIEIIVEYFLVKNLSILASVLKNQEGKCH